jgi:hypothetical protein
MGNDQVRKESEEAGCTDHTERSRAPFKLRVAVAKQRLRNLLVSDSSKLFQRDKNHYLDITSERKKRCSVDGFVDEATRQMLAVLTGKEEVNAREEEEGNEAGRARSG